MQNRSLPPGLDSRDVELEIEKELAIERGRSGLLGFTLHTKPDYQVGWHHRALCRKLNAFAEGRVKRLMVFMPPRHGKSELVSRRLPAYILGRNPDAKIIAASHTSDLASAMNRDVQRIIESDYFRELYPETTLSGQNIRTMADGSFLRNASEFEIVGHQGAYKCAGVGGGIAGRGGDFLILDDPIKDAEEAESTTHRQNLWDWYATTFSTRAQKGAGILITLTRWHEDDLAGRLLTLSKNDPEADQWEIINFPAIRELTQNDADPREEGEALWPEFFSLEALKKIRATSGSRVFNGLYQQRPSSEEGDILKREWMTKRYKVLPKLSEKGKWSDLIISTDMRFKDDKTSGDYVVHQAWGRIAAQVYFLGELRGRWGFLESVAQFERICRGTPIGGFKPYSKIVENKANGPALESVLRSKIPGIILFEPQGSKTARVHATTPFWEAGNIWLPDDSIYPDMPAIVEEWVSFGPGCAFDDRSDTMSQAIIRFSQDLESGLEDLVRW